MKLLLPSLFISCSLLTLNSYSAPGAHTPELDSAESYVGEAARSRSYPNPPQDNNSETRKREGDMLQQEKERVSKKPRTEANSSASAQNNEVIESTPSELTKTSKLLANGNNKEKSEPTVGKGLHPRTFSEFLEWPNLDASFQAIRAQIIRHLDPDSQKKVALVHSNLHRIVVAERMSNDRRALSTKLWVEGPPFGSQELYRLNAAMWHAFKHTILIKKSTKNYQRPRHELLGASMPISKVYTFLKQAFDESYPQLTKRLTQFLSNMYDYLTTATNAFPVPGHIRILAGDSTHRNEQNLMALFEYLTEPRNNPLAGFYADPEDDLGRMSILKRSIRLEQFHSTIALPLPTGMPDSVRKNWMIRRATGYDYVLKYSLTDLPTPFYSAAAKAHYDCENYSRAAELWDEFLPREGSTLPSDQEMLKEIIYAFYTNKNYPRTAELSEELLKRHGDRGTLHNLTLYDFIIAADAFYRSENFTRCAQYVREVQNRVDENTPPEILSWIALSYYRCQKYSQAIQFVEEILKRQNNEAVPFDFLDIFIYFHANPLKFADRRAEILKADWLSEEDRQSYKLLFQDFESNIEKTLEAIDCFIDNPENKDPWKSTLNNIVYQIGWMLHSQAGHQERADEIGKALDL